ncbi:MAG: FKBP-type peptidyl-prolyl cis-trans isomerase [Bacteroidota bacterium]
MNRVNSCLSLISVLALIFIAGCGQEEIAEAFDANEQYKLETELIRDYLAENNFEEDTTDIGVRLVVTDQGSEQMAEIGDVIYFDFAGRFLNRNEDEEVIDTAYFDTTIFSIAEEELGVEEDNPIRFRPVVYTYSEDGWTLTQSSGGTGFIVGFRDGVTELLKIVGVGGAGEIVLPSRVAYGTAGRVGINPNQVLIFEIYLRRAE